MEPVCDVVNQSGPAHHNVAVNTCRTILSHSPFGNNADDGTTRDDQDDIIHNINMIQEGLPFREDRLVGSNSMCPDTMTHHNVTTHQEISTYQDMSNRDGKLREAPPQLRAVDALKGLVERLHPRRKSGQGYSDADIDPFIRVRMEGMCGMLNLYTNPLSATYNRWGASACQAAIVTGKGRYCACQLCRLTQQFILDRMVLPINPYGQWNESMLADEDLAYDLKLHLQELGKNVSAKKIVEFLSQPDVKAKHEITKSISERTASRYLNSLGYRWSSPKKGQYSDGHERADVVQYRDQIFIPEWKEIEPRIQKWSKENEPEAGPLPGQRIIPWFHDETVFYAHDRRKQGWYHKDAPATPYMKGEGASLMIADFVSVDFGWLKSPDGTCSARRIMRPGKNRDGYFTCEDIKEQAQKAIDIVSKFYPEYEHQFYYDNASTHLKRPVGSLSARNMPKNIPKPGNNWLVEGIKHDANGKPIYRPDGTVTKEKVQMADAQFIDGTPQSLYFAEGHERAGVFKGMAVILEERGFANALKLRAECKGFKCTPSAVDCCCRRLLYSQPDFAHVDTILETAFKVHGFQVKFLPKFHCELNFIEQCWGYAKRLYRLNPESSREDHLERNALAALDAIPLASMRRFGNRACRFIDAYSKGLNGSQAAWAARKYHGHRVLPLSLMDDLEAKAAT